MGQPFSLSACDAVSTIFDSLGWIAYLSLRLIKKKKKKKNVWSSFSLCTFSYSTAKTTGETGWKQQALPFFHPPKETHLSPNQYVFSPTKKEHEIKSLVTKQLKTEKNTNMKTSTPFWVQLGLVVRSGTSMVGARQSIFTAPRQNTNKPIPPGMGRHSYVHHAMPAQNIPANHNPPLWGCGCRLTPGALFLALNFLLLKMAMKSFWHPCQEAWNQIWGGNPRQWNERMRQHISGGIFPHLSKAFV